MVDSIYNANANTTYKIIEYTVYSYHVIQKK